jgi:hypothetical protein
VSEVVRLRSFSPSSSALHQGGFASAFCRSTSVPGAVVSRCTTRVENTHGTEFQELLYPWHPWSGLRVCVHEAIERADGIVFRCSLSGSEADRWLEVPAWMFERAACAWVRVAAEAHVDLAALTTLAALLRHVLNDRFASSNAPLSDVSSLSRNQNRGELHATPNEADAGAPPRAAADRPVRRRTAKDDRQHAGVVWAANGAARCNIPCAIASSRSAGRRLR